MASYPPLPIDLPSFVEEKSIEHVLCSFSGGKDSLVATHLTHKLLSNHGVPIEVLFVDTTVGLPDVKEYVKKVASSCGWKLKILTPEKDFLEIASRWGMPTPKRRWCCRLLKLEPLLKYAVELGKQRILFTTGLRRDESHRRSKMKGFFYRRYNGVEIFYVDPIINWSDGDVEKYIKENNLPLNPLYKLIGFSGECFCGTFSRFEHLIEVARHFPEFIEKFKNLEEAWKRGKFREKNYKVFYVKRLKLKLSVDELLRLARQHDCVTHEYKS
jgi:3'-phosphoadenosine 5'-phosphosulfate sulfotransferase (PAPS reductase)/FAD synthetase